MKEQINHICSSCGTVHEEWPALVYSSPTNYDSLSEEDKQKIGELDSDFCVVKNSDQIDRFIRCTLTLKVIDYCENLEYGLWVSLSEKSFKDYSDNFNNADHKTKYFGWLSNDLPDYDFSESIPTTVFTRSNNERPEIVPHKDFVHPLVDDYYNGITKLEAEKRIKDMLAAIEVRDSSPNVKKAWWKFW